MISKKTAKTWIADYISRTSFYAMVLGTYEFCVMGLDPTAVLRVRLGGAAINLVSGPAYGKFREVWSKVLRTEKYSSESKKTIVETLGSTLYGVATYSALLGASGVSLENILKGMPFVAGVSLLSGRPYGVYADYIRDLFGVKSILKNEEQS